jgi:hypothetical protein
MSPIDAAHQVVHEYPGGSESLAPRLGKAHSTLRAELNPSPGTTAKLGLMTAVAITNLSGDLRIVAAFNEACGCCPPMPLPRCEMADGSIQELLERGCELSKDIAETFSEFQRDIADGKVTPNELQAFEREALEAIASIAALARAMRGKMESDQRTHIATVTTIRSA